MAKKKSKFPLMWIEWIDHYGGNTSWTAVKEFGGDIPKYVCLTVGFAIEEDKDQITLVQTFAPNDLVSNTMTIIKKCIVKRKNLGYGVV